MEKLKNFFKMLIFLASVIAWVTIAVIQGMTELTDIFVIVLAWLGIVTIGVGIGMFVLWLLFDLEEFCKSSS